MTKKVLYIDPITTGVWHSYFNSFVIKMLLMSENFVLDDIVLNNEQLDVEIVKTTLAECSKTGYPLDTGKDKSIILEWFYLYKQFKKLFNKKEILIIGASDNLIVPSILLYFRLFRKTQTTIVFLHNNIESSKNSFLKRFMWNITLKGNVYGVILSKFVYDYATTNMPNKNILYFPHFTYSVIIDIDPSLVDDYCFDFLILGRHSESFGLNQFTQLLLETCSNHKSKKEIIVCVGDNSGFVDKYPNVKVVKYNFPATSEEYWGFLKKSKFIIYPPLSGKRLTASGVHLDSISMKTPTIAPFEGTFNENTPQSMKRLLYHGHEILDAVKFALNVEKESYLQMRSDLHFNSKELNLKSSLNRFTDLISTLK